MTIIPADSNNNNSPNSANNHHKQVLAVTLLGKISSDTLTQLDKTVCASGSSVYACQVIRLGQLFGMLVKIGGAWNTLGKLETSLPKFAEQHQLQFSLELTTLHEPQSVKESLINPNDESKTHSALPYAIEIIALQAPGLLEAVSKFCSRRGLYITELLMNPYTTAHTATAMVSLNAAILVPAQQPIAALREDFMDFADSMNFDAIIEPLKA